MHLSMPASRDTHLVIFWGLIPRQKGSTPVHAHACSCHATLAPQDIQDIQDIPRYWNSAGCHFAYFMGPSLNTLLLQCYLSSLII